MTESQMIIFKMAVEKLGDAILRQDIITGAALGLHKDENGNKLDNKYSGWAGESDKMKNELSEAQRLLLIIKRELQSNKSGQ